MFGKRLWAIRIIDHAGLKAGEQIGAELVDLIVSIAKQTDQATKSVGSPLDDASIVIQSALIAANDERTVRRLVREIGVSEAAAQEYASLLHRAAEVVAVKYDREGLLRAWRDEA